jgi:ElaB/YqjD/DUF883 family membrane-anchored ribosome-binding protein
MIGETMAERGFDEVAKDFAADLAALREDVRKLTSLVADLAGDRADHARSSVVGAVDKAREHLSSTADRLAGQASDATDRVRGAGAELEARIERNPITAVMIAIVGGLLIGALSRSRR